MSRNRKSKVHSNGRNATNRGRFARLGHDLLKSPAYRSLTPNARALLVEIISMENQRNNGLLWLSESDAASRMGVGCPKVARKAFRELVDAGFIAMTKNAHWNITAGEGRARCWRLTWEFNVAQRKPATNEWQKFEPTDKAARIRMDRGLRALADYRKQLPQIQKWQGNLPDTIACQFIEQGDLPDTTRCDYEKAPFLEDIEQGDLPSHTAVTSMEDASGGWQCDERSKTGNLLAHWRNLRSARLERTEVVKPRPNKQETGPNIAVGPVNLVAV